MDQQTYTISDLTFKAEPLLAVLDAWRRDGRHLVASTSQSPEWAEGWMRNANADCIAVTARHEDRLEMVLVLEVVSGPLKTARFCSDTHANANFPAISRAFSQFDAQIIHAQVRNAVSVLRPEIDMIELSRMIELLDGVRNPLLSNAALETDIALSLAIHDGFEAVLETRSGSRKRKKMRQMANRMKERGGWAIRKATERDDILKILACFYKLKSKRLAESGVRDVFGDAGVQAFFNDAFTRSAAAQDGQFELHVLEVDGTHVAIAGCCVRQGKLTVEFGGISDEDASLSPGDFLFFHMIEDACARGLKVFSFGTGDEHYKRTWCDIETRQFNLFLPLSLRGRMGTGLQRLKTAAKRTIKANDRLYSAIKKLRKSV